MYKSEIIGDSDLYYRNVNCVLLLSRVLAMSGATSESSASPSAGPSTPAPVSRKRRSTCSSDGDKEFRSPAWNFATLCTAENGSNFLQCKVLGCGQTYAVSY